MLRLHARSGVGSGALQSGDVGRRACHSGARAGLSGLSALLQLGRGGSVLALLLRRGARGGSVGGGNGGPRLLGGRRLRLRGSLVGVDELLSQRSATALERGKLLRVRGLRGLERSHGARHGGVAIGARGRDRAVRHSAFAQGARGHALGVLGGGRGAGLGGGHARAQRQGRGDGVRIGRARSLRQPGEGGRERGVHGDVGRQQRRQRAQRRH